MSATREPGLRVIWPSGITEQEICDSLIFIRNVARNSTHERNARAYIIQEVGLTLVLARFYCTCGVSWFLYEVLARGATLEDAELDAYVHARVAHEHCPRCWPEKHAAEWSMPTARAVLEAVAQTPAVHEMAVAADMAHQRGLTTHEQARHPGDAALLDALLDVVRRSGVVDREVLDPVARARIDELWPLPPSNEPPCSPPRSRHQWEGHRPVELGEGRQYTAAKCSFCGAMCYVVDGEIRFATWKGRPTP